MTARCALAASCARAEPAERRPRATRATTSDRDWSRCSGCRRPRLAAASSKTSRPRRARAQIARAGADRGEPAPRRLDREALHAPRAAVPRPDPGGEHRASCARSRSSSTSAATSSRPTRRGGSARRSPARSPTRRAPSASRCTWSRRSTSWCASRARSCRSSAASRRPRRSATRMELPADKVRRVLRITREPISLETPVGEDEDGHLGDFIEDESAVAPADAVVASDLRRPDPQGAGDAHAARGAGAPPALRDRRAADLTLEEVGTRFAVTRERIRQIEAKALRKLRHPIRARQLREFLRGADAVALAADAVRWLYSAPCGPIAQVVRAAGS